MGCRDGDDEGVGSLKFWYGRHVVAAIRTGGGCSYLIAIAGWRVTSMQTHTEVNTSQGADMHRIITTAPSFDSKCFSSNPPAQAIMQQLKQTSPGFVKRKGFKYLLVAVHYTNNAPLTSREPSLLHFPFLSRSLLSHLVPSCLCLGLSSFGRERKVQCVI